MNEDTLEVGNAGEVVKTEAPAPIESEGEETSEETLDGGTEEESLPEEPALDSSEESEEETAS